MRALATIACVNRKGRTMVRPYNLLICSVLWGFSAALREAPHSGRTL